jgi:hypothetical protein
MVEHRSHVADCPDPRRLGMEWFLDAVFPNGKIVAIRGFAGGSEASECPGSFRYIKSTRDIGSGPGAQATILSSENSNVRALGLAAVAAALSKRMKQVWKHVNGRRFDVQTSPAALKCSIALACGLASIASGSLSRLRDKWENATSSPRFALLCAGVSFAALLLLTGAFAGMALTKQSRRSDMITERRIGGITSREKSQPIARNFDSDLIAVLIELTSREEVERQHSALAPVPLGLPRILLDGRSFATVPLNDRPPNSYFD